MDSLYDLLGALPRDDAEELRAAFRRAVKGAHPDLHPGDPDAGEKFREIVRANEILSDEDQRAAYDHLLDLAGKEQRGKTRGGVLRRTAVVAMSACFAAALGVAGCLVYLNPPRISGKLLHLAAVVTARPGDFASLAPSPAKAEPPVAVIAAEPRPPDINVVHTVSIEPTPVAKPEATDAQADAAVSPAPVSATGPESPTTATVRPPLEIVPGDARMFFERGVFAYRSGDFEGAVAQFDRAIRADPKFLAAYVERGIVLYRMQRFERAYADIAQARRIEKANRARAAQPGFAAARKPSDTLAFGLPPFLQRRARIE